MLLQANAVLRYVMFPTRKSQARYPSLATDAEVLKLLKYEAVSTEPTQTKTGTPRRRGDGCSSIDDAHLAGKRSSPFQAQISLINRLDIFLLIVLILSKSSWCLILSIKFKQQVYE